MTSPYNVVLRICLNDSNVDRLLEVITSKVALSEKSYSKCKLMLYQRMASNISSVDQFPSTKNETATLIKILNKQTVEDVIDEIIKKNPHLFKPQSKQVGREKMERDLETYGRRGNHFTDRPYSESGRHKLPPQINDPWASASGSSYASAFSDNLITTAVPQQNQPPKRGSDMEARYQDYINQRNMFGNAPEKPPTPDFTLDGSGDKVRQQKMQRKLEESGLLGGMNPNPQANPMQFGSMPLNDNYALNSLNQPNPIQGGYGTTFPTMDQSASYDPYASILGNPVQQHYDGGMYQQQMSAKASQLQNDLERKLNERKQIDIMTGQPQAYQTHMSQQQNLPLNMMGF